MQTPDTLREFLKTCSESNYDVVISPSDASAGKLDGDEKVRVAAGAIGIFTGLLLVFIGAHGLDRQFTAGAGLAMIPTSVTLMAGSKKKT